MTEEFPGKVSTETPNPKEHASEPTTEEREMITQTIMRLGRNLAERCEKGERFEFPGMTLLSRRILEEENARLLPEYQYDLEVLLQKFKDQGMRIVMTPNGTNVMVMPGESSDLDDNLRPHHLEISSPMESELEDLVKSSSVLQTIKRMESS